MKYTTLVECSDGTLTHDIEKANSGVHTHTCKDCPMKVYGTEQSGKGTGLL
jgi:hypothetical protein